MKSLSTSIKEGLESFNLDLPIYNEVIKLFDSQSKKEWSNRLNYLYNIVTPQWTRVYKRNIPVNKEDGMDVILGISEVGDTAFAHYLQKYPNDNSFLPFSISCFRSSE